MLSKVNALCEFYNIDDTKKFDMERFLNDVSRLGFEWDVQTIKEALRENKRYEGIDRLFRETDIWKINFEWDNLIVESIILDSLEMFRHYRKYSSFFNFVYNIVRYKSVKILKYLNDQGEFIDDIKYHGTMREILNRGCISLFQYIEREGEDFTWLDPEDLDAVGRNIEKVKYLLDKEGFRGNRDLVLDLLIESCGWGVEIPNYIFNRRGVNITLYNLMDEPLLKAIDCHRLDVVQWINPGRAVLEEYDFIVVKEAIHRGNKETVQFLLDVLEDCDISNILSPFNEEGWLGQSPLENFKLIEERIEIPEGEESVIIGEALSTRNYELGEYLIEKEGEENVNWNIILSSLLRRYSYINCEKCIEYLERWKDKIDGDYFNYLVETSDRKKIIDYFLEK